MIQKTTWRGETTDHQAPNGHHIGAAIFMALIVLVWLQIRARKSVVL